MRLEIGEGDLSRRGRFSELSIDLVVYSRDLRGIKGEGSLKLRIIDHV